jgi:replicative DNA helicase
MPHSVESEQGMLGCALIDAAATLEQWAVQKVRGEWFHDVRHQLLSELLMEMHAAGKPVDLLTVAEAVNARGIEAQVGGMAYVSELQDKVPSAANLPYYVAVVRDKFKLRQVLRLAAEVSAQALEPDQEPDALVAEVGTRFLELAEDVVQGTVQHIKEPLREVVDDLEQHHYSRGRTQLPPGYLPTGIDYLDKLMGGLAPTDYVALAGRPGSGKTTLALQVILYLAEHYQWWRPTGQVVNGEMQHEGPFTGVPVGVFSLEMSNKSLGRRLLFNRAQVSAGKFKQGFATADDVKRLVNAAAPLGNLPIYLSDEGAQTIGQIEAKARRMVRQFGVKLFVLDYLQLVLPNKRSGRIDRVQELTDISTRLVALKKALKVPWLVLAQMNRNIEQAEAHRVPVLSDLRDCGAIEQDADQVGFLYFPERPKNREGKPDKRQQEEDLIDEVFGGAEHSERPQRVNWFQAKNRDGATGPASLLFFKNQFRFEDWRRFEVSRTGKRAKGEKPGGEF